MEKNAKLFKLFLDGYGVVIASHFKTIEEAETWFRTFKKGIYEIMWIENGATKKKKVEYL